MSLFGTAASASMRPALTALLDSVQQSRHVFRHLAVVEQALTERKGDGDFLFDLSSDQLSVMQRQLESLLDASPPPGLAELRTILREALKLRHKSEARQPLSSFFVDHKLEVSEAGPTDFERLQSDWLKPSPKR